MNSDQHDTSTGNDQSTLGGLKEKAGEKVSQVADSLKQEASKREEGFRGSLSGQADQLASALRSAKSEIDADSSIGKIFDYAADSVGSFAQNLKSSDTTDLVEGVRGFARQRPGAFLGLCALGGFAAARFLLASAPASSGHGSGGASYSGRSQGSDYPGSYSRQDNMTGRSGGTSGVQARTLTGAGQSGQSNMGQSGAGLGTSGSGTSGSSLGHGSSSSGSGTGGISGSGPASTGMTGSGSGTTPSTASIGSNPSASSSGIGGSGTGSEAGGDLSGTSGSQGGASGSSGSQSHRNPSAPDRDGGRNG
ncbi:hypothetical protein [Paracoccus aerius]|mgnify:FL=1|uniref:Nutrient deprivation-induced protein n=1 Tax=Paracoccus aerius TaxID=1915382 RepID=A0ABS1S8K4_9RHOB|nr:hypothetical protein [Paracoccus aerius]MBL3675064.1 hypothetical protein [Paracoccus aerius]